MCVAVCVCVFVRESPCMFVCILSFILMCAYLLLEECVFFESYFIFHYLRVLSFLLSSKSYFQKLQTNFFLHLCYHIWSNIHFPLITAFIMSLNEMGYMSFFVISFFLP